MNTDEYGDVLLIPNSETPDQLPNFFEPLGTVDEMTQKYRFITEKAYQGTAYGLALGGNASGFVYNKKVWAEAGITDPPTTPVPGGLQVIVTAQTLVRDLALLVDRVDPDAVVDDMLVSLLPGESVTFTVRCSPTVDPDELTRPDVLRSANQLVGPPTGS
jgi:hypothetical protein